MVKNMGLTSFSLTIFHSMLIIKLNKIILLILSLYYSYYSQQTFQYYHNIEKESHASH